MTTEEPDHYATLQVAPTAEPAVIAAAYRALARRYHPDVAGAAGEEAMRRINAAWEVLGDPERRADYDRRRAAAGAPASAHPTTASPGSDGPAGSSRGTWSPRQATATAGSAGPEAGGPPRSPGGAPGWAAGGPAGSTAGAPAGARSGPYGPAGPPPGRPQGSVLPFGLFRGWSIGEIARVDPGYLEWLEGKREGRPYLAEIDEILRATGWRRAPDDGGRHPGRRRGGLAGRWRGRL